MDMNTDSNAVRRAFGRFVSLRCAYEPKFVSHFGARDERGCRVVVPVLGTDTVDLAAELVMQSGGKGVLVILDLDSLVDGDKATIRIGIANFSASDRPGEAAGISALPYSAETKLADLWRVAKAGTSIELRRDETAFDIIDIQETEIDAPEFTLC
jgi:hypothetical protein